MILPLVMGVIILVSAFPAAGVESVPDEGRPVRDEAGLPSNIVTSLVRGNGGILIGTSGGAALMEPDGTIGEIDIDGTDAPFITSMASTPDLTVFGTTRGPVVIIGDSHRMERLSVDLSGFCYAVAAYEDRVFASMEDGLIEILPEGTVMGLDMPEGSSNTGPIAANGPDLTVATSEGLYSYGTIRDEWTELDRSGGIADLVVSGDRSAFVTVDGRLFSRGSSSESYRMDLPAQGRGGFSAAAFQADGGLIAGTTAGFILRRGRLGWATLYSPADEYAAYIRDILADDDLILAGTDGCGLIRVSGDDAVILANTDLPIEAAVVGVARETDETAPGFSRDYIISRLEAASNAIASLFSGERISGILGGIEDTPARFVMAGGMVLGLIVLFLFIIAWSAVRRRRKAKDAPVVVKMPRSRSSGGRELESFPEEIKGKIVEFESLVEDLNGLIIEYERGVDMAVLKGKIEETEDRLHAIEEDLISIRSEARKRMEESQDRLTGMRRDLQGGKIGEGEIEEEFRELEVVVRDSEMRIKAVSSVLGG